MTDLTKLFEGELERASIVLQISALSDTLQDMAEKLTKMTADVMPITDAIKTLYSEEAGEKFDTSIRDAINASFEAVRETKDAVVRERNRLEGGISDEDVSTPQNDMMDDIGGDTDEANKPDAASDELELDSLMSDGEDQTADVESEETTDGDLEDDLFGGEEAAASEGEPLGRAKKESHTPGGESLMEGDILSIDDLESLPSIDDIEEGEEITIPLDGEIAEISDSDVETPNPIYSGPVVFVSVRFPDGNRDCEQLEHEIELLAVANGGDRELTVKGKEGVGFSIVFPLGSDGIQPFMNSASEMGGTPEYDPSFIQYPVDEVVEMAERYLSTLSEDDEVIGRLRGKLETAIIQDSAKVRSWLEGKLNIQPIRESEGDVSTYVAFGKTFKTKTFTSDDAANAFMEENPDWGVIGVKDGLVHVADINDDGEVMEDTTRIKGREFDTETFPSMIEAKEFLSTHPNWGIIDIRDGVVHVAEKSDEGTPYMEDVRTLSKSDRLALDAIIDGLDGEVMTGEEMVEELLVWAERHDVSLSQEDAERLVYTVYPDSFPNGFVPQDIMESTLVEFATLGLPRDVADRIWGEDDVEKKRDMLLKFINSVNIPTGQKEFAIRAIQQGNARDLDSWAKSNMKGE